MTGPSTPRGEQRREAFVAAARKLFIDKGIEGLQVNEVVRLAGGSLATLYAYFPSKKDLLRAVAMHGGFQSPLPALCPENDARPLKETLVAAALGYAARILDPQNLCTLRAVIACATRNPEVAKETLLGRREAFLEDVASYLMRQKARGTVRIDNAACAALQFQSLVCGPWYVAALYGAQELTTPEYLRQTIEEAVETFLCRFAAASGGDSACQLSGTLG